LNSSAPRAAGWIAVVLVAAALTAAGYWLLFSTFQPYDDEGYVLYSLKNYGEQGHLYDIVFSQYGPFFFAYNDALHRMLGFEWTNTSGRMLTLVYWLLTAGFSAALVWRATRSVAATAFSGAGVYAFIWVMINEPGHPGGPIGCFVALAAFVGSIRNPSRSVLGAVVVGAIGAALALTKINVGAFLLFSAAAWAAFQIESPPWRRAAGTLMIAWLLAMPWILMSRMLGESATRWFAVATNLATIGWAAVAARHPVAAGRSGRAAIAGLAGAAALTLLVAAVTLVRGTTLSGLLHGVLLDPLNQPDVFSFAVQWQPAAQAVAVGATAIAVWSAFMPNHRSVIPLVAGARMVAAVTFAMTILQVGPFKSLADYSLSYGVTLAAVCAVPLRRDEAGLRDARTRLWLAVLLLLQSLHAYPVAGSQVNWATFLWLPLLVLAVRDAALAWPATAESPGMRLLLPRAGATIAWLLVALMTFNLVDIGWAKTRTGAPLDQPGAETIRTQDNMAFGLRIIAENARAHSDLLYSLPGLYSLNLWTGLPTPTFDNATQWFLSLSEVRQRAIIDRLEADPKAAFVVQRDTLEYLIAHGFHVRGALAEFMGQSFEKAFEVDGYGFWVHRGRRIAALSTGHAVVDAASGRTRLDLVVASPGAPVASIELSNLLTVPRTHLATLTPASASLDLTPLDATGSETGGAIRDVWQKPISNPIVRLSVEFDGQLQQTGWVLAQLLDADGHELAAVRILE